MPVPDSATLAFVGDVNVAGDVDRDLDRRGPDWFWGDVQPLLQSADAVIANLETPITRSTRKWPWPKAYKFRARPETLAILQAANIRLVNLANNHMVDHHRQGVLDTIAHLDAAGIAHVGAGGDADAAERTAMIDVGGLRVGAYGLTDNVWEYAAKPDRPGTNFMWIRSNPARLDRLRRASAALDAAGAHLRVVSAHWGPNMRLHPIRRFRRFAADALAAGFDMLHGHSAHVVQRVERIGGRPVLYDCGNFLDDYWPFPFRRTLWSFIFFLDLRAGRPTELRLTPVKLFSNYVRLASGELADRICDLMVKRCRIAQVPLQRSKTGLRLELAPAGS